jgi:hypothetical protein
MKTMTEKWRQRLKELEQHIQNRMLEFELRLSIIELKRASLGMD